MRWICRGRRSIFRLGRRKVYYRRRLGRLLYQRLYRRRLLYRWTLLYRPGRRRLIVSRRFIALRWRFIGRPVPEDRFRRRLGLTLGFRLRFTLVFRLRPGLVFSGGGALAEAPLFLKLFKRLIDSFISF
jgi:hypothetical protein